MAKNERKKRNHTEAQSGVVTEIYTQAEEQNSINNGAKALSAVSDEYESAVRLTREKVTIHQLINFDKQPDSPIKVSIVVPVCNVEQYLRECLDSCVNQTLREIEIICVNDGSTDGCLDILKEYAEKDDRVRVIDKDNAGYGHTMNIGMDMARGEYIGIVESDDFVELNMYEELYKTAEENGVDWVKADFNRFLRENDGSLKCTYNDVAKKKEYYNKVMCPLDEPFSFRFIMNTWSGIYRRDFLVDNCIRHQETPGASFQDNGFWFQTMIRADRIYVVDKPYYMNRRDNPNSSVYNKKKVYNINHEYNYIHDILSSEPELFTKFIGIYTLKKFHNYMNNYRRIGADDQKEYLINISEDFRKSIENGEYVKDAFMPYEADEFEWVAFAPEDYYEQHCADSIKVSVIIPVYNTEKYLRQCLDSVLNQTMKEIEVICVDDGSTDSSAEILKEYEANDDRVKVLYQDNLGAGAARNKGLAIAKGEYLSFLDSDDFFEPEMLESIYDKCKKRSADIGVFKVKIYHEDTGKTTSSSNSFVVSNMPNIDSFTPEEMNETIFETFQTWAWNKLFMRHFVEREKLSFQEIHRTNDMAFVNTALIKAHRITVVNKELVNYRMGGSSNCQATNFLYPTDFFAALLKLQNEIKSSENGELFIKSFHNLVVRSSLYNLNSLTDANAFAQLYRYLHDEGLEKVGLDTFDISEISKSNTRAYKECVNIRLMTYEEYMFDKLTYHRENSEKMTAQVKELSAKIKNLNGQITKKVKEIEDIKRKNMLEIKFADKDIIQKQNEVLIKKGFDELKKSMRDSEDYKTQLLLTRASFSYKIGLAITWLPRKIRGLFKKNK